MAQPAPSSAAVAAVPGGIVGLNLQNAGAQTLQGGVTTLGQTFVKGDLAAGQKLTAMINGVGTPVQVDVKTTWPDGSVKMAVLSLERPDIAAGGSVNVVLAKTAAATAQPAVNLATATQSHSFTVDITPQGGSTIKIDVLDALRKALADGSASKWQEGPLATQARVVVELPGSQRAEFDVTAFKGGGIQVDAQFNNDQAMQATGGRANYTAVVTMDGQVVATETVSQAQYQNWSREFSSNLKDGGQGLGDSSKGWLNIRADVDYLQKTGAVADYDLSMPVRESLLQSYGTAIATADWGDALSANGVTKYMPATGHRPDIGISTEANAAWLMTQDARAAEYAMGQAQAAGAVPWNFFDQANKTWLNTDNYPKLWTDPRGGTGTPGDRNATGLTQQIDSQTGWEPDQAHQPSLSYVPYLQTGERWILDNLQAQASRSIMATWNAERLGDQDLVANGGQVRAGAWSLREIDNAAWVSPDGSAEKAFFQQASAQNWSWLVSKIPEWTAQQGNIHGWVPGHHGTSWAISPWTQDYFASVTIVAASRGNADARTFLEWQSNYLIGRFTHAAEGMNPHDGVIYRMPIADATTGAFYKTWGEVGAATVANGWSVGTGWENANYAQLGLATLAGIYSVTGSQAAADAYRMLVAQNPIYSGTADLAASPINAITIPSIYYDYNPTSITQSTPSQPGSGTGGTTGGSSGGGTSGGGTTGGTTTGGSTSGGTTGTGYVLADNVQGPATDGKPVITTIGSGPDTLLLRFSQQAYLGSAQYIIKVDGVQIGGVMTAGALAGSGQFDQISVKGNWVGTAKLDVMFLSDAYGTGVGQDRNLFLQGVSWNGVDMRASSDFHQTGTVRSFTLSEPITATAITNAMAITFSNESNADFTQQIRTDSFNYIANTLLSDTLTGTQLDIAGVATSARIARTTDATGKVSLEVTSAWNSVKNVYVRDIDAGSLTVKNFVDVDLGFGNGGNSSITVLSAKRGVVSTGNGNDTITVTTVTNDTNALTNSFRINAGAGADTIVANGAANGGTRFKVDGGAGADRITLNNAGIDTIVLRKGEVAGDIITGFNGKGAAAGDVLSLTGFGAGSFIKALGGSSYSVVDGAHTETFTLNLASGAPALHLTNDVIFG
jgi:hypothetical protein